MTGSLDIRKELRKLLLLDCVRNKDRMAVEPIVCLTRSTVLDVLKEVTFVVHKVVPEKYRFWKSNQDGQSSLCKKPIALKRGSQGKILVLDYNFVSHESRLVALRLHQPVDVEMLEGTFKDARDFCFSYGVVFVAEPASSSIRFIDIEAKVTVKPGSLKSRTDLLSQLSRFSLPLDGTVPVLRKRLDVQLQILAAEIGNSKFVQVQPPSEKPTSICGAIEDILLCADDTQRGVFQVRLHYNGVGISGTGMKLVNYPTGISSVLLSMEVFKRKVYFAAAGVVRGLYVCNLPSLEVDILLKNNSESCVEIKTLCEFENGIAFTDLGNRKVKLFCPAEKTVKTLLGSGQEGTSDEPDETCLLTQVHGICSLEKTLFASDVAAGTIKLVSGLSGTVSFLQALGSLYDSFGIPAQSTEKTDMSLQDAKVSYVNDNITKTVSEVKQRYRMKETTATINGPEGTVSKKTQVSLNLLEQGMCRLHDSITTINKDFLNDVELCTLLTTVVENLHAVSHFKHETFTVLQYSKDFGTITKESLKRITKWGAKYFTHDKSYYPVPQTSMEFANINFMQLLLSEEISPKTETAMKELVEKYRPVRQRTVRGETTKDKAGALPPAIYLKEQDCDRADLMEVLGNDLNTEEPIDFTMDEEDDSGDDFSDKEDEDIAPITISRSGQPIRAHFRLDL